MSFCSKCGAQLVDEAVFCSICGSATQPVTAPISQLAQPLSGQPTVPPYGQPYYVPAGQQSTYQTPGPSRMESLIKNAYQLFQFQFGGDARKLFVVVFVALLFSVVVSLCKTMKVSALGIVEYSFSFISLFGTANDFGAGLGGVVLIIVVGVLALVAALVIMVLPFFRKMQYVPRNLTLAKIAILFSFILNVLIIIIMAAAVSSQSDGMAKFSLTFGGWLYLIVGIATVITVFMLSSRIKKFELHWRMMGQTCQIV